MIPADPEQARTSPGPEQARIRLSAGATGFSSARPTLRALCLGVAVTSILLLLATYDPTRWEELTVEVGSTRVPCFLKEGEPSHPIVLLTPGAYLPGRFLVYQAEDFHRAGFGVALLDLNRVSRPEQAIEKCLLSLRADPRLAQREFVLYAHSASVSPAFAVAGNNSEIRASVFMGYDPGGLGRSQPPNNLLLVFGVFDDYISQKEMLVILSDTGGPAPQAPGLRQGDFGQGTARELLISPLSNHGGEPFDPGILSAASSWYRLACRLPEGEPQGPSSCIRPLAWCVLAVLAGWWMGGWARQRAAGAAAVVTLLLVFRLVHPLAGLLLLALLTVRKVEGAPHLLGILLALNAAVVGSYLGAGRAGTFVAWVRCVFWSEVIALPCQATGLLLGAEQNYTTLVAGFGLVALATCCWPDAFRERTRRWTAFCRQGRSWFLLGVPLGMSLAWPGPGLQLFVATLVYLVYLNALAPDERCSLMEPSK